MTVSPVPYISKVRVDLLRENARSIVSRSGHAEKHSKSQVSFSEKINKIKLFLDRKTVSLKSSSYFLSGWFV